MTLFANISRFLGSPKGLHCSPLLTRFVGLVVLSITSLTSVHGDHLELAFSEDDLNRSPSGYVSLLTGAGQPGIWQVVMEEMPSAFAPLTSKGKNLSIQPVVKQISKDPTDERFPLLIMEDEVFGDFTFSARFKLVDGEVEQMAGLIFRVKDHRNYYVVRASGLGQSFKFYKFVDGVRSQPVGPDNVEIPSDQWNTLKVQCEGNKIRCFLNDRQWIPEITDTSFLDGRVGFWTKSDSVVLFGDAEIEFTPKESLAEILVRTLMKKYDRLIGLKIIAKSSLRDELHVVASSEPSAMGRSATEIERSVVEKGRIAYGKERKVTTVTMPLRDRNGIVIAAVQVNLETYFGQIEKVAIARAVPILREIELKMRGARRLTQ